MNDMDLVYLVLIFLAATSGAYGLVAFLIPSRVATERLGDGKTGALTTATRQRWLTALARFASPLAQRLAPEHGDEYSRLRRRFLNAGLRNRAAVPAYYGVKVVLALLLPLAAFSYLSARAAPLPPNAVLIILLATAGMGFLIPSFLLDRLVSHHQRRLLEAFPDAIDLLVICVEAGLGLDAALQRVAEEIRVSSPRLAEELHLVTLELRVGSTREDALRNLALRTGLDDVNSLATMLIQSDRFGTNVADALRLHADTLRAQRQMRAEEAAAKVPVKLVLPVVLCIFPALLLVLGGPPFISIYRNLLPMLAK